MSFWDEFPWWLMAVVGVAGCGLSSGLEIGLYSLNRVRLHLLSHQGRKNAQIIDAIVQRPPVYLATLLIITNAMTNLATGALSVLLEGRHYSEAQVVLYDLAIVTPVLFIFAEVLPKDLFAAYADHLVYHFARTILWASRLLRWTGILPLIELTSAGILRLLGARRNKPAFHPRYQIEALVKEGVGYGLLSDEQSAIVERVMDLSDRSVGEEMVPWAKVLRVDADDPPSVLWRLAEETSVSRFPVTEAGGRVVGVVSLYDALLHRPDQCPPLRALTRPAPELDRRLALREGLSRLRGSGVGLAIINDRGRAVGIVTIKDLIEPITGELVSW